AVKHRTRERANHSNIDKTNTPILSKQRLIIATPDQPIPLAKTRKHMLQELSNNMKMSVATRVSLKERPALHATKSLSQPRTMPIKLATNLIPRMLKRKTMRVEFIGQPQQRTLNQRLRQGQE